MGFQDILFYAVAAAFAVIGFGLGFESGAKWQRQKTERLRHERKLSKRRSHREQIGRYMTNRVRGMDPCPLTPRSEIQDCLYRIYLVNETEGEEVLSIEIDLESDDTHPGRVTYIKNDGGIREVERFQCDRESADSMLANVRDDIYKYLYTPSTS